MTLRILIDRIEQEIRFGTKAGDAVAKVCDMYGIDISGTVYNYLVDRFKEVK